MLQGWFDKDAQDEEEKQILADINAIPDQPDRVTMTESETAGKGYPYEVQGNQDPTRRHSENIERQLVSPLGLDKPLRPVQIAQPSIIAQEQQEQPVMEQVRQPVKAYPRYKYSTDAISPEIAQAPAIIDMADAQPAAEFPAEAAGQPAVKRQMSAAEKHQAYMDKAMANRQKRLENLRKAQKLSKKLNAARKLKAKQMPKIGDNVSLRRPHKIDLPIGVGLLDVKEVTATPDVNVRQPIAQVDNKDFWDDPRDIGDYDPLRWQCGHHRTKPYLGIDSKGNLKCFRHYQHSDVLWKRLDKYYANNKIRVRIANTIKQHNIKQRYYRWLYLETEVREINSRIEDLKEYLKVALLAYRNLKLHRKYKMILMKEKEQLEESQIVKDQRARWKDWGEQIDRAGMALRVGGDWISRWGRGVSKIIPRVNYRA